GRARARHRHDLRGRRRAGRAPRRRLAGPGGRPRGGALPGGRRDEGPPGVLLRGGAARDGCRAALRPRGAGRAVAGAWLPAGSGRLRLGWRLLLFLATGVLVAMAVGLLLPPSALAGSAAVLAGAVVGGWVMLARDHRSPAALGFPLGRAALRE